MKIGIIGSGNVGGMLGTRWAGTGHEVVFALRHPESAEMRALAERAGGGARAATALEAALSSDVILLATPWPATREAVGGESFDRRDESAVAGADRVGDWDGDFRRGAGGGVDAGGARGEGVQHGGGQRDGRSFVRGSEAGNVLLRR